MLATLFSALQTSLTMILVSAVIAMLIGFPLGGLQAALGPLGLIRAPLAKTILHWFLMITHSIPFVALAIAFIPTVRYFGGMQSILAVSIPLSIATIPWIAQGTCDAFAQVSKGLITTSTLLGGSPMHIIRYVALPESMPLLISVTQQALIRLVAYTTLAGLLGAGGLGKLITDHGLTRFEANYVFAVIGILILLTQGLRSLTAYLTASRKLL